MMKHAENRTDDATQLDARYRREHNCGKDNGRDAANAIKHCVWACLVRKNCGADAYNSGVIHHETDDAWWGGGVEVDRVTAYCGDFMLPIITPVPGHFDRDESPMDLGNDEMGRKCSRRKGVSREDCCLQNLKSGRLFTLPIKYWE
jgi:hypothetical protein